MTEDVGARVLREVRAAEARRRAERKTRPAAAQPTKRVVGCARCGSPDGTLVVARGPEGQKIRIHPAGLCERIAAAREEVARRHERARQERIAEVAGE